MSTPETNAHQPEHVKPPERGELRLTNAETIGWLIFCLALPVVLAAL
jgi:hypothetical protein